jgi:tetratricopeptide (TPR) repeat protein
MELRHYSEAMECINESLEYAGDKVPDLYFRRAQAICYNKYSNEEDYQKAFDDINKAISLKKDPIYNELFEKMKGFVENKKTNELEKINSKLN